MALKEKRPEIGGKYWNPNYGTWLSVVLMGLKENLKTGKTAGTFLDSSQNPSFEESDATFLVYFPLLWNFFERFQK